MPAALLPRAEVVARLHDVFRERGFDGASLAELSNATGLGKSSLYHYFPGGKDEMAVAVLERIDAWMNAHALAVLRGPGTPKKRLRLMLDAIDAFFVGGRNACVLGNLVVGGSREKFQAYLTAAFGAWIAALRALAVEAVAGAAVDVIKTASFGDVGRGGVRVLVDGLGEGGEKD